MNAHPAARTGLTSDLCTLAVQRKIPGTAHGPATGFYRRMFSDWLAMLSSARFMGVVLDYDGTVCETSRGHAPPRPEVRAELVRLLHGGRIVAFASGRGRTLHRELRRWVPKPFWPQVTVGLYNGGVRLALTDDLPLSGEIPRPDVRPAAAAALAEVVTRLSDFGPLVRLDVRIGQVTVKPVAPAMPHDELAALTRAVVSQPPAPAVCVLESARAIDIVPASVTKAAVVAEAAKLAGGPVLTAGDQGQLGGNDFALLACQVHSLSVDRCSTDPTRCWNLASPGVTGPAALHGYLTALRSDHAGMLRFCLPHPFVEL